MHFHLLPVCATVPLCIIVFSNLRPKLSVLLGFSVWLAVWCIPWASVSGLRSPPIPLTHSPVTEKCRSKRSDSRIRHAAYKCILLAKGVASSLQPPSSRTQHLSQIAATSATASESTTSTHQPRIHVPSRARIGLGIPSRLRDWTWKWGISAAFLTQARPNLTLGKIRNELQ